MQPLSSSACLLKRSITASLQRLSRLLCYGLCGGFAWAHAGIVVSDDLGTRLRLERPAQRIITLAPHLTETLFAWPGIGKWLIDSINRRDYPAVQGGILLVASVVMLVNLLVDLLYGLINPRIRHAH